MNILFEDNHIIAVNKNPGEIVQEDKTGDNPLFEKVKEYIRVKYNKPGEAFLGVIHRIDRPVSGIVLFAKTGKALERMNEMFREKTIQKIYLAVVKNKPPKEQDVLVHYLTRDEKKNLARAHNQEVHGSKRCELSYSLLAASDNYFLLEVNPITGRHHQIRVQLSKINCPIKGDIKYGSKRTNPDGSIHLHARQIDFIHPVKKEPIRLLADPPSEPLWNSFVQQLNPPH